MKIGVVSELTGGADICQHAMDLGALQANSYLGPSEVVLFALSSPKEEYTFTNESLVTVCGDSAMSIKRTIKPTLPLRPAASQTATASSSSTWALTRSEQPQAQHLYRMLQELSRTQGDNVRLWDFAKSALGGSLMRQPPVRWSPSPRACRRGSTRRSWRRTRTATWLSSEPHWTEQWWCHHNKLREKPRQVRVKFKIRIYIWNILACILLIKLLFRELKFAGLFVSLFLFRHTGTLSSQRQIGNGEARQCERARQHGTRREETVRIVISMCIYCAIYLCICTCAPRG